MLEDSNDPFVTLAEGANLLGVTPRTVQRYATRLATGDRIEGDMSATDPRHKVLRVRLSALAERAGKPIPSLDVGDNQGGVSATDERQDGDESPTTREMSATQRQDKPGVSADVLQAKDDLIHQLRAEVARSQEDKAKLYDALERSQGAVQGVVAELAELRREYNLLQAATRARRIMLPVASDAPESDDNAVASVPEPVEEKPQVSVWQRLKFWEKG